MLHGSLCPLDFFLGLKLLDVLVILVFFEELKLAVRKFEYFLVLSREPFSIQLMVDYFH